MRSSPGGRQELAGRTVGSQSRTDRACLLRGDLVIWSRRLKRLVRAGGGGRRGGIRRLQDGNDRTATKRSARPEIVGLTSCSETPSTLRRPPTSPTAMRSTASRSGAAFASAPRPRRASRPRSARRPVQGGVLCLSLQPRPRPRRHGGPAAAELRWTATGRPTWGRGALNGSAIACRPDLERHLLVELLVPADARVLRW